MRITSNPYRGQGLPNQDELEPGEIVTNPSAAIALMALCPAAHVTPLLSAKNITPQLDISQLFVKDERGRMGLGSFKALGAAFAIAKQATAYMTSNPSTPTEAALIGTTFVCASAGNHGLSMAAGARIFGATAVVYLSKSVPESFAGKLTGKGAIVVREGDTYEDSMTAAQKAARENNWQLLSDSSWHGYSEPARDVMEGYLIMGAELADQMPKAPDFVFLQAGVGGLAAAMTAMCRYLWQDTPQIIIVEPEEASCIMGSIEAGHAIEATGDISNMGRLDCKEPSHLALRYLAKEADYFMNISDQFAEDTCSWLANNALASTPSGIAGIAGLKAAIRINALPNLNENSTVLTFLSEEATSNE